MNCDCFVHLSTVIFRVTTFQESPEMSGILTAAGEMLGILLKVKEVSWKNSRQGKLSKNYCYLCPYVYLVASSWMALVFMLL